MVDTNTVVALYYRSAVNLFIVAGTIVNDVITWGTPV